MTPNPVFTAIYEPGDGDEKPAADAEDAAPLDGKLSGAPVFR